MTRSQRPRSPPLPDVIKNAPSRPPPLTPPFKSVSQLKKGSSAWANINTPRLASILSKEEASTSKMHHNAVTARKYNSTSKTLAKPTTPTKPYSAVPQSPRSPRETPNSKTAKMSTPKKSATVKSPQVRFSGMKTISSLPAVLQCCCVTSQRSNGAAGFEGSYYHMATLNSEDMYAELVGLFVFSCLFF